MSDHHNVSTASAKRAAPGSPARPRLRSDYIVAAVIIVFAIIVYALTTTFDSVPKALSQGVPPQAYPRLLVWVLIALSIGLIFEAHGLQNVAKKRSPAMVYKTAVVLIVAVGAIQLLGIFGTMLIACAGIPPLWGERRHWVTALFTVLLPLAVYGLFHGILQVQFPLGVFQSMF